MHAYCNELLERMHAENKRLRAEVAMWKDRYEALLRDAQASEKAYDKMSNER